jgi:hypothetical protein
MLHRLSYPGPLVARCVSAFGVVTVKMKHMSAALDCSVVMYVVDGLVGEASRFGASLVASDLLYCH